ncbi:MAG: TfoX/Sxy family protein [Oscillospiraceae bacterium]|nr:TfoX/Sxy family protein [Oscillospiraceae bacterium]
MATTTEYIAFVCEQIPQNIGEITYKKMFGEYIVYLNGKPVLSVCDNTVYVKKLEAVREKLTDAEIGYPYEGAKEHYVLDIEDRELCKAVLTALESVTATPKPRKKPTK